jgi:hypothetical protein
MIYTFITVKKIEKFLYHSRIGVKREGIKSANAGARTHKIKKYKKTHAHAIHPNINAREIIILRYFETLISLFSPLFFL